MIVGEGEGLKPCTLPKIMAQYHTTKAGDQTQISRTWSPFQPIRCLRFESGLQTQFYDLGPLCINYEFHSVKYVWIFKTFAISWLTTVILRKKNNNTKILQNKYNDRHSRGLLKRNYNTMYMDDSWRDFRKLLQAYWNPITTVNVRLLA
jgi:hypothetical protein